MGQVLNKTEIVTPINQSGLRIINIRTDLQSFKQEKNLEYEQKTLEIIRNPERLLPSSKVRSKVIAHYKNIEINYPGYDGSLFGAFIEAYNNHEDITLVPDDIWITILFQFSKYINNNAEKMRNMFVSHSGKKQLTVVTHKEESENQWEEFFNLMIEEIKKNTKDGIVNEMQSSFSTTGMIERIISVATVMDSFKEYFDYGRMIPMCGIKNVRFAGTLEDWQSILSRLRFLGKYDVDGKWKKYISNLEPIILKFIDTYNGKVDIAFWDKVMNITHGSLGSGATSYVTGWILLFYNQSGRIDIGDIDNDYTIDVTVKLDNRLTGTIKEVGVRAKFAGLNKTDGSYRPQLSMIIYEY